MLDNQQLRNSITRNYLIADTTFVRFYENLIIA